jgi:hypothetical protein
MHVLCSVATFSGWTVSTAALVADQVSNGSYYTLVLEFESKLDMEKWEQRRDKFESFFGPGIIAELQQTAQGVDVLLVTDGSGKGIGGQAQKDALPPLMPGLKARQQ